MKQWPLIIALVLIAGAAALGAFYWQNLRGIGPVVRSPRSDITAQLAATTAPGIAGPLSLPPGFSIDVFAKDLPGARALVRDSFGNYWVSQSGPGSITQLEVDATTGKVRAQHPVLRGLQNPHGLAFESPQSTMLYFAEEHRIARVPLYADGSIETVASLPAGGGHSTRTIGFGPDRRLYASIGSSCNVCEEKDPQRATIISLMPDGSDLKTIATGVRNAVFFTWHPRTNDLWATENSRDLLGDDLPPDEINVVKAGSDYGWPWCYGQKIVDVAFNNSAAAQAHCQRSQAPTVEIPAHSAPLGLSFIPEAGWPEEYWHDLIVAYHGSWNRSEPTGYKLVRIKLDESGKFQGIEDFVTGWLQDDGTTLGRPVGVLAEPGGTVLVTDDKAGVIYRIRYDQTSE